jgi:WD40 repeat protein
VRRVVPLILAVLALLPAAAAAKSNDSDAPSDAPPHWLPPEAWVYNHWIPYDEGRLYSLLHVTRQQLWQQLRDDHRNIAQLAARHGWRNPAQLADALVAPWRGHVGRARLAVLRGRAVRTLTQGHLSQHLFFHSLHQFAIPSRAPRIFGMSDAAFRDVRRTLELSPLTTARLHGRSPARVEALSVAALRERARAGVAGHAITARQARILLRRQITQLPRWLGQARYNGPPKTHRGLLVALPHDYATNPSVSADGTHVVYEQYRQKLPVALRLGEIAVVSRDLRSGRDTLVSRPAAPRADEPLDPRSAYNATVSGDGRLVAYESSPGNVNFAKRYGRIGVRLADAARGRTTRIDHPPRGEDLSQSAYNPQLAADGRHLAFQAVRGAGTAQVFVCDLHTGARTLASGGLPRVTRGTITSIYEPRLSADGRFVAFTAVTTRASGGPGATASSVVLRDLVAHTSTTVRTASRPSPRIRPCPPTAAWSPSRPARRCPSSTCATVPKARPRRSPRPMPAPSSTRSSPPTGACSPTPSCAARAATSRCAGSTPAPSSGWPARTARSPTPRSRPTAASWPSPPTRPTSPRARPTAAAASSPATCPAGRPRSSARRRSPPRRSPRYPRPRRRPRCTRWPAAPWRRRASASSTTPSCAATRARR